MARYTDADKVMEEINRIGGHNLCEWETLGVRALIDRQPTADVVPKSEVEELKGELAIAERHEKDARALFKDAVIQLQNARQEVAREIFESIEECIYLYYNKNDYTMPNIEEDIAELKKKYTEEEK